MRVLALALMLSSVAASAQSLQIPITGTLGSGGVFPLLYPVSISITDANHSMTYPETSAFLLKVNSSVGLTAVRSIIAPSVFGFCYDVENATTGGFGILLSGTSGTGPTIPSGRAIRACYDGTNYVSLGGITLGSTNIAPGTAVGTVTGLVSLAWSGGATTITNGAETLDLGSNPNAGLILTGSSTYGTHAIMQDKYLGNTWYYGVDGTNQANFTGDFCVTTDATWAKCPLAVTAAGIIPAHIYSQLNCFYVGSPAQCGGETNGISIIYAGTLSEVINTSAVSAGSEIFITTDESAGAVLGGGVTCNAVAGQSGPPLKITARNPGVSFTVTTTATLISTNPVCFTWMIQN
jgi:hypothetical protein